METLVAYNFIITYQKGFENARANALNKRNDYVGLKQERPCVILKETNEGIKYNELLTTIAVVENTELETRLKETYVTNECAKKVLAKTKGDFIIDF